MAPDLNSVPASPRPLVASSPRLTATSSSRRASQQMGPPPLPLSSPVLENILPSNQSAVASNQSLPSPGLPTTTSGIVTGDNTGVGIGPGPLRHPRPLTAADLHMQLEKEQEAVVNRLTRELSLLRAAQNASVVSNSSSTSNSTNAGLPDTTDVNANHLLSGPSHPTPSTRRHQRSSSSTSARSITGASSVTNNNISGVAGERERPRASINRHDSNPPHTTLSRQNSMTSSRRSGASSPAPEYFPYGHSSRGPPQSVSMQRERSSSSLMNVEVERAMTSVPTTGRYEEVAFHRHELEAAKRENEALKRRIRELELLVRSRRESDASTTGGVSGSISGVLGGGRGRSESESTNTSMVRGRGREGEAATAVVEDAVRVGESAGGGGSR